MAQLHYGGANAAYSSWLNPLEYTGDAQTQEEAKHKSISLLGPRLGQRGSRFHLKCLLITMSWYCTLSNCLNILGLKILLSLAHPQRRDYIPKLEKRNKKKRGGGGGSPVSLANYPCWKEQASFPGLTSRGIIGGDLIPDFMKRNITSHDITDSPHSQPRRFVPLFFHALLGVALILTTNSAVFHFRGLSLVLMHIRKLQEGGICGSRPHTHTHTSLDETWSLLFSYSYSQMQEQPAEWLLLPGLLILVLL